jgi:hypothetical protein
MKFEDLLEKVSGLPAFTVRFLAAGENLAQVRLQINRWVRDGKIIKIHKGLYAPASPYQKVPAETFCVANALKQASYISLHSALSLYGMIPEYVPCVTSITAGRPQCIDTPLGRFEFRHITKKYFWGYRQVELQHGLKAFVAYPEKALLDLVYLTAAGTRWILSRGCGLEILSEWTGQGWRQFAEKFNGPKMRRAAENIETLLHQREGIDV